MTPRRTVIALAAAVLCVAGAGCRNDVGSIGTKIGGTPLSEGTAHVAVSGGEEVSFDAPLEKAQVGTAVTVFVYRSSSDDLFSITGLGIKGSAKTGNSLALTITVGDLAAASVAGECTITVAAGEGRAQRGTATCRGLDSSQGRIDVDARFDAAP